jgi:hypothetical protein
MTDEEIRTLVREVLSARQLVPPTAPVAGSRPPASFGRVTMVPATPSGSPCVIEPSVICNHCGYCVSLGH